MLFLFANKIILNKFFKLIHKKKEEKNRREEKENRNNDKDVKSNFISTFIFFIICYYTHFM